MTQSSVCAPSIIESTYPASLLKLIHQLTMSTDMYPETVTALVKAANITETELMPWATFEHPVNDSYGRKLVFDGGRFEIMVMSWIPGDYSGIHDHGSTQWGAVQCFGEAEHYAYDFDQGHLSALEDAHYSDGMVRPVSHHLIHQMGNPGNEPFLSLHVYGCSAPVSNITGDARIFDLSENSIQYTDGGVFFCLPETAINRRDWGLTADRITTQRHHRQMRDRIHRILQVDRDQRLVQKLASLEV